MPRDTSNGWKGTFAHTQNIALKLFHLCDAFNACNYGCFVHEYASWRALREILPTASVPVGLALMQQCVSFVVNLVSSSGDSCLCCEIHHDSAFILSSMDHCASRDELIC